MNDKKIIEEMARLDGLKQPFYVGDKVYNKCGIVPDYPNSHDACQPVIDRMDLKQLQQYSLHLLALKEHDILLLHQATPRQKCEAILKAHNKWEDA